GPNRPKLAADLGRRVRLQVNHVLVWRTTRQEDHDDRLVRPADAGVRLGPQDLRQRQASQSKAADPEGSTPGDAIAEAVRRATDRQHGTTFPASGAGGRRTSQASAPECTECRFLIPALYG